MNETTAPRVPRPPTAELRYTADLTEADVLSAEDFLLERLIDERHRIEDPQSQEVARALAKLAHRATTRTLTEIRALAARPGAADIRARLHEGWSEMVVAMAPWLDHPHYDHARWYAPEHITREAEFLARHLGGASPR
ncbi:hypothetical protein ACGFX4_29465 [Kitasatospora sp. NPDC048365]|uniref:hypothetical protein n=1 Tax=Kitasatospora sp. NPDC048365 TaxID=3364050 RepID=UPI003714EA35